MKRVLTVLGVVLGAYLIVRAVAEPFVIDMTDPATYRHDWGGPTLAGVLLVHCGPGVLAALLMVRAQRVRAQRVRAQRVRAQRKRNGPAARTGPFQEKAR